MKYLSTKIGVIFCENEDDEIYVKDRFNAFELSEEDYDGDNEKFAERIASHFDSKFYIDDKLDLIVIPIVKPNGKSVYVFIDSDYNCISDDECNDCVCFTYADIWAVSRDSDGERISDKQIVFSDIASAVSEINEIIMSLN